MTIMGTPEHDAFMEDIKRIDPWFCRAVEDEVRLEQGKHFSEAEITSRY